MSGVASAVPARLNTALTQEQVFEEGTLDMDVDDDEADAEEEEAEKKDRGTDLKLDALGERL